MRPISLLDRYIIRGFTYPFLFCVFGFTIILLSGILFELTDFIFVKNVAISLVGKMLLYKLPEMVVLTLPIAVLFATLLSLGKLQSQSELTVMRCSGVPFRRIIVPILIIAFVVSVVTYQANERVVPWANHQFENIVRKLIFEDGIPVVQENVFFHGGRRSLFLYQKLPGTMN